MDNIDEKNQFEQSSEDVAKQFQSLMLGSDYSDCIKLKNVCGRYLLQMNSSQDFLRNHINVNNSGDSKKIIENVSKILSKFPPPLHYSFGVHHNNINTVQASSNLKTNIDQQTYSNIKFLSSCSISDSLECPTSAVNCVPPISTQATFCYNSTEHSNQITSNKPFDLHDNVQQRAEKFDEYNQCNSNEYENENDIYNTINSDMMNYDSSFSFASSPADTFHLSSSAFCSFDTKRFVRFKDNKLHLLEQIYEQTSHPSKTKIAQLSNLLLCSEKKIEIQFSNRRSKDRKQANINTNISKPSKNNSSIKDNILENSYISANSIEQPNFKQHIKNSSESCNNNSIKTQHKNINLNIENKVNTVEEVLQADIKTENLSNQQHRKAPKMKCPQCLNYCHVASSICPKCGHNFPKQICKNIEYEKLSTFKNNNLINAEQTFPSEQYSLNNSNKTITQTQRKIPMMKCPSCNLQNHVACSRCNRCFYPFPKALKRQDFVEKNIEKSQQNQNQIQKEQTCDIKNNESENKSSSSYAESVSSNNLKIQQEFNIKSTEKSLFSTSNMNILPATVLNSKNNDNNFQCNTDNSNCTNTSSSFNSNSIQNFNQLNQFQSYLDIPFNIPPPPHTSISSQKSTHQIFNPDKVYCGVYNTEQGCKGCPNFHECSRCQKPGHNRFECQYMVSDNSNFTSDKVSTNTSLQKSTNSSTLFSSSNRPRPYICQLCSKRFQKPSILKRHMRVHTGEKPYICSHCDKPFAHNQDKKRHEMSHTGEKPFKCHLCNKGFIRRNTLTRHLFNHQQGSIPTTSISPAPDIFMSNNVPLKPFLASTKSISRSNISSFKKGGSETRITQKNDFENERNNSNLKILPGTTQFLGVNKPKNVGASTKKHKCRFCEKKFDRHQNLIHHERVHTGEKPFQCHICLRKFSQEYHVQRHLKTHDKNKDRFSCDVEHCTRVFSQSKDLKDHKKYDHGNYIFACSFCDAKFRRPTAVKRHIKRYHSKRNTVQNSTSNVSTCSSNILPRIDESKTDSRLDSLNNTSQNGRPFLNPIDVTLNNTTDTSTMFLNLDSNATDLNEHGNIHHTQPSFILTDNFNNEEYTENNTSQIHYYTDTNLMINNELLTQQSKPIQKDGIASLSSTTLDKFNYNDNNNEYYSSNDKVFDQHDLQNTSNEDNPHNRQLNSNLKINSSMFYSNGISDETSLLHQSSIEQQHSSNSFNHYNNQSLYDDSNNINFNNQKCLPNIENDKFIDNTPFLVDVDNKTYSEHDKQSLLTYQTSLVNDQHNNNYADIDFNEEEFHKCTKTSNNTNCKI